jgi:hypothetical protein
MGEQQLKYSKSINQLSLKWEFGNGNGNGNLEFGIWNLEFG